MIKEIEEGIDGTDIKAGIIGEIGMGHSLTSFLFVQSLRSCLKELRGQ